MEDSTGVLPWISPIAIFTLICLFLNLLETWMPLWVDTPPPPRTKNKKNKKNPIGH